MAADREERKLVTVLFADVAGSTSLGERSDPEYLRAILQRFFTEMSDVIVTWGGTVEKYAGDAVLAVFGIPTAREDDPVRAVRAALGMQDRLASLNRELRTLHESGLQVRIGVNTGEVIAPTNPAPDHQLLMTGDAVNVAARLEQAAEPGTILVGDRTWQLTRDQFTFDGPTALNLRGKSEPIEARRVVAALAPDEVRTRPVQAPLIGRDNELRTLRALFDTTVEARAPSLAILYGPAGIGKSRLTREFLEAAAATGTSPQVLRGRCLSAGEGITFWALGEVLRACAGIGLAEPAETAAMRFREGMASVLGPLALPAEEVQRATFALAATAGLVLAENPLDGTSPEVVDEEMGRAWPLFASGLAARLPTVLLVEDLHWADDRLVEMLARTATRAQGPLLLLATARPEFAETHPEFATSGGSATALSLRPLTDAQGAEMIAALLDRADLPAALREDIIDRAEGNPFFVEELVAGLVDQGVLVREGDRWQVVGGATATLPDTVHAVLAARIDALPGHEKRVLQEAAVFGRTFWSEPLIEQLPDIHLPAALASLERRGLVNERATSSLPGQIEHAFKHQLIRDVAYAAVPKSRRARAHLSVAEWTERLAGDRVDELGELIAYHYRAAVRGDGAELAWIGDPEGRDSVRERAFRALVRAGTAARRRLALASAIELHRQALDLAASDAEQAEALEAIGDDHAEAYHGDDAMDAYRLAMERAKAGGGPPGRIASIAIQAARIGTLYGTFRQMPPIEELEDMVAAGLEDADDQRTRARVLMARGDLGRIWIGSGFGRLLGVELDDPVSLEQRRAFNAEARELAHAIGDADLELEAAMSLNETEWLLGDYDHAAAAVTERLALVPTAKPAVRRDLLLDAALDRLEQGLFEASLDLAYQALAVPGPNSLHHMMHISYAVMAAAFRLGRWDEVLARLEPHQAAAAAERDVTCSMVHGGPLLAGIVLAERGGSEEAVRVVPFPEIRVGASGFAMAAHAGRYAIALGDPDRMKPFIEPFLQTIRRRPMHAGMPEIVELLVALGDWTTLASLQPQLRGYAAAIALVGPVADWAEASAPDTAPADAVRLAGGAVAAFDRMAAVFDAARARELLARLEPDEGTNLLVAAALAYRGLSAVPHLARVEAALNRVPSDPG